MIRYELLRDKGSLVVNPSGPLEAEDFWSLSAVVDPYIEEEGRLTGLLIEAPSFPGWDSFAALVQHMRFVSDHHRNIERVAAVSDSAFSKILPRIADHFAHPDIRVFDDSEKASAMAWLEGR